jgi:nucleolar protein 58
MLVTRHIINLAGVVRECDHFVNKHDYSLRSVSEHLKRISSIDTQEWDLMKLATALKMICYPEEKIAAAPLVNCNIL